MSVLRWEVITIRVRCRCIALSLTASDLTMCPGIDAACGCAGGRTVLSCARPQLPSRAPCAPWAGTLWLVLSLPCSCTPSSSWDLDGAMDPCSTFRKAREGMKTASTFFFFSSETLSNVEPLKGRTTLLKPLLSLGGAAVSGAKQSFREAV